MISFPVYPETSDNVVPTLLGIPLWVFLRDRRFIDLARTILEEQGGNPDDWAILKHNDKV